MIVIQIICEGKSEELFVNNKLKPHFKDMGIALKTSLVGKVRSQKEGGNVSFERIKRDILNYIYSVKNCNFCTCLIDFYGISNSFPGYLLAAQERDTQKRFDILVKAFEKAVQDELEDQKLYRRFIPYVQMHELEALYFSDMQHLSEILNLTQKASIDLAAIEHKYRCPEDINNDKQTAPSKRISQLLSDQNKSFAKAKGQLFSHPMGHRSCTI